MAIRGCRLPRRACLTMPALSNNPACNTLAPAAGGTMAKVVKRNSTIPVLQEKEFTTCVDNQSTVSWKGVDLMF